MSDEPLTRVAWSSMAAPVMKVRSDGEVDSFLGTGFMVAASTPAFITAGHVIRDNPLLDGESYYVFFQAEDGRGIHASATAKECVVSERYDVAALSLGELPGVQPLYLDPTLVPNNETVTCREYSGNSFRQGPETGKRVPRLHPRAHLGNIMSWYTSYFPESQPAPCVELSFPALQGASGAPVVRDHGLNVVAILVANVEQELTPAQVLRIDGPGDEVREEVRYFLPLGKGLRAEAIIEFLQDECGLRCASPPPMYLPGKLV